MRRPETGLRNCEQTRRHLLYLFALLPHGCCYMDVKRNSSNPFPGSPFRRIHSIENCHCPATSTQMDSICDMEQCWRQNSGKLSQNAENKRFCAFNPVHGHCNVGSQQGWTTQAVQAFGTPRPMHSAHLNFIFAMPIAHFDIFHNFDADFRLLKRDHPLSRGPFRRCFLLLFLPEPPVGRTAAAMSRSLRYALWTVSDAL